MMAVYAAMINRIDFAMGTLVKGLEERGALDNTLILFLSDNGGNAEGGPPGETSGALPRTASAIQSISRANWSISRTFGCPSPGTPETVRRLPL